MKLHRNSQKRIYGEYVYFITAKTQDAYPYFKEKLFANLWMEELKITKIIKEFKLYAFCLNHNHFHLLLKPKNVYGNYSEIIKSLKQNFSRDINKVIEGEDPYPRPKQFHVNNSHNYSNIINQDNKNELLPQLGEDMDPQSKTHGSHFTKLANTHSGKIIDQCTLQYVEQNSCNIYRIPLGEDMDPRLRQKNIFISKMKKQFNKKYQFKHNFPKFKWQKSFYDHIIRDENDYKKHWEYTMYNYKKHNLPNNWKYTGINFLEIID